MNDDLKIILAIVGIVCITVLEVVALICNVDGTMFGIVISGITAIITLVVGEKVKEKISGLMGKKDDVPSSTN